MPTCNFCSKSFTGEASLRNHQSRWCPLYLNHKKKKQQLIRSILLRNKNSGESMESEIITSYSKIDTPMPIPIPIPHNVITENENDTASGSGGIRRSTRVPITKFKPGTGTTTTATTTTNPISDFESTVNFASAGIDPPNFRNSASVHRSVSKEQLQHPFSPYDCRYCTENFPSMEDRSIHERQRHVPAVKPYKCKSCPRRFFFAADCNYHEELHSQNCLDLTINVEYNGGSSTGNGTINNATEQELEESPNNIAADIGNNGNESGSSSTDSSRYFNCKLCTSRFINKRRLKLHMNWRHAGGHENGSQRGIPAENQNENFLVNANDTVPSQNNAEEPEKIINRKPMSASSSTSSKCRAQNSGGTKYKSNKKPAKAKVIKINNTGVSIYGRSPKVPPKIQLNPNHAVEEMQPNGKLEYICVLCGKQLRRSYNALAEHSNMHTGYQPFQCEICDKNFRKPDSLVTHKTVHSGIKLLKCHICQKSYRWPSGLYTHVKRHKL